MRPPHYARSRLELGFQPLDFAPSFAQLGVSRALADAGQATHRFSPVGCDASRDEGVQRFEVDRARRAITGGATVTQGYSTCSDQEPGDPVRAKRCAALRPALAASASKFS